MVATVMYLYLADTVAARLKLTMTIKFITVAMIMTEHAMTMMMASFVVENHAAVTALILIRILDILPAKILDMKTAVFVMHPMASAVTAVASGMTSPATTFFSETQGA